METMDRKVLVLADTEEQMSQLSLELRASGLDVLGTSNPDEVLRVFYSFRPSLVLLDLDVPESDVWELCSRIRDLADTAIIVTSGTAERESLLRGYEIGIDGYFLKPLQLKEVVQRTYEVLRRHARSNDELQFLAPFESDSLLIDWSRNEVKVRGNKLSLTPTEFKLLGYLAQNPGRVLTHEQILSRVWGHEYIGDKNYVKLYIRYLREKIEEEPSNPRWIVTERGFGYRFAAQSPASTGTAAD